MFEQQIGAVKVLVAGRDEQEQQTPVRRNRLLLPDAVHGSQMERVVAGSSNGQSAPNGDLGNGPSDGLSRDRFSPNAQEKHSKESALDHVRTCKA
jgi:hypothetical protein